VGAARIGHLEDAQAAELTLSAEEIAQLKERYVTHGSSAIGRSRAPLS
jgi:hypothetical protein